MFDAIALNTLETIINQYIALDPDIDSKRESLEGKCLKLIIKPVTLYFLFQKDKIAILSQTEQTPDAILEGYPLSFLKLHFADNHQLFSLFKTDISMQGDIEVGQQVKQLFERIDIDWEEHLSRLTGDIVAHQVSQVFKRTLSFGKHVLSSAQHNMTDYLQEECRILPTKEELADYYDDVDNLRLRVDRLAAKIKTSLS